MYTEAFGVDVPTTQSQPIESTKGTHRTTSAPRTPNPDVDEGESNTIQLSLAEQKSQDELEAKQNVQKVEEHLIAEEIEKLVKGTENVENVEVDSSTLRQNDNQNDPNTRLDPRSNTESPEVEITAEVQPVYTIEEEDESSEDDYELKRREKGKEVEETRHSPSPTTIKSPRIHSTLISSDTEKLQELTVNYPKPSSSTPSSSSPKPSLSMSQHILSLFKPKTGHKVHAKKEISCACSTLTRSHGLVVAQNGRCSCSGTNQDTSSNICSQGLIIERQQNQANVAKMIADAIQQDRDNLRAEISLQINNAITNHIPSQVDSSVRNYMSSHILHVHPTQASSSFVHVQQYQLYLTMKDNPQLQHDDLPIWLALKIKFEGLQASNTPCRTFAIRLGDQDDPHDDAHPEGENSAKRQKTSEHGTYVFGESSSSQVNESEPCPSTSDDDELPTEKVSQELVEEMSQTVDEAKLRKVVNEMMRQRYTSGDEHQYHIPTPIVQNCQRDPKAHALYLVNQDLLYLKKGNSGPEKIVLSLHKFPAVIFSDDDIEERTSRWIVQIIKTYWELGHEHKFITEIIARRVNGSIVSITESDYKNLNKNDIEDLYLLIVNGKLGVESYQQKVNLTALTITFPGIKKHKMFSIVSEPVYGIIYKNNKKEKRAMRYQEHGYVTLSISKEVVEYLQLFEEEIEERLKHRDQMRRWEMYMNGRPLGSRRERPE
ncbi:hypothetical protein Tco_0277566 [Tanacetum coccineum]